MEIINILDNPGFLINMSDSSIGYTCNKYHNIFFIHYKKDKVIVKSPNVNLLTNFNILLNKHNCFSSKSSEANYKQFKKDFKEYLLND